MGRRVLATGAGGMVGHYLSQDVIQTDVAELDITDAAAVDAALEEHRPDVVYHLAAETNVDRCEQEPDRAYAINAIGTQNVALACRSHGAELVYVSSAQVFDGEKHDPYHEFDEVGPVTVYGRSKLAGEEYVRRLVPQHYIVRAGWMIGGGPHGEKKFIAKMLEHAERQGKIVAVNDKFGSPTRASDLVERGRGARRVRPLRHRPPGQPGHDHAVRHGRARPRRARPALRDRGRHQLALPAARTARALGGDGHAGAAPQRDAGPDAAVARRHDGVPARRVGRGAPVRVSAPEPALAVQMLGTRGLPNKYGGSETCIEEVGVRLLERGHEVRIFSRPRVTGTDEREFRGMEQVPLPRRTIQNVDTLTHSLLAILWLARHRRADDGSLRVLHFHGSGNGAVVPFARALRLPTVVTVDGPDWRRAKWGPVARRLMRGAAWMATRFAGVVVADSREAVAVYREDFGADTTFIPYGAPEVGAEAAAEFPAKLRERGLEPGNYILFVGRFTPEKEIHTLVRAHALLPEPRPPLVLVGGTPDDSDYAAEVAAEASDEVHFVGKLFGDELDPVARGTRVYVQPSAVEGTSPMILTAMAYGLPLIASGIPENRETIGPDGEFFPAGDAQALADAIGRSLADPVAARAHGEHLRERVRATYSWDAVTDSYVGAYREAIRSVARTGPRGRGRDGGSA